MSAEVIAAFMLDSYLYKKLTYILIYFCKCEVQLILQHPYP
jgi:hypothetical protein